jgi:hypothetical protein
MTVKGVGDKCSSLLFSFVTDPFDMRIVPYIYRYLEAEQPGEYRETSRAALIEGVRELSDAMSPSGPFSAEPA